MNQVVPGPDKPEWAKWCEPCGYKGLKNPAVTVRTEAGDTPVCEWHDEHDQHWGYAPFEVKP